MAEQDWGSFTLSIPIKSSREKIYAAWTSQQELERWFLRSAVFTKADGSPRDAQDAVQIADQYEWMWHGYPDEVNEKGVVLQENGKDLFKFSFGKAGNVTITISEEEGEPMVHLLQDEIPTDEYSKFHFHIGCSKGWVFYLANLKSILEGGIDLRNKKLHEKEVINS